MTYAQLVNLINTNLTRMGTNRVTAPEIKEVCQAILDFAAAIDNEDAIPTWTSLLTFQTDGSDAGKYCKHPDDNGKLRIFETKIDDNINNPPPTDPDITENASWQEISASAGSGIQEWAPGIYGAGLVIVYHNHSVDGSGFYKLLDPVRPFNSTNIEAEITAGKWERVGGAGSGKSIDKVYADVPAMLADQAAQKTDFFYFVTDASADATVDTGWALYQKLSTTSGVIGDYRKLGEQESLDLIFSVPAWSESDAGKVEKATQSETDAETDDDRGITPLKLGRKPRLRDIAHTSVVDLEYNLRSTHSIAGAIAYTKGAASHKAGNERIDYLTANGINKPTFSADFVVMWDNWVNTINAVNRVRFEYLPNGKIAVDLRWIE